MVIVWDEKKAQSNLAKQGIVVYAYKHQAEIRIISARKATKKEAKFYEERI